MFQQVNKSAIKQNGLIKSKFNKTLEDSDAIFIDPKVQQIWRKHKV